MKTVAVVDDRTRDRVARSILEHGPSTAAELAAALDLTAPAVRRHLDALVAEGLVLARDPAPESPQRSRGRGRPARSYALTDAGHAAMTTAYDDLAASALRFLAQVGGAAAVERFAQDRVADLERRYLPLVESAGPSVGARAEALAAALSADGYAASTRVVGHDGRGVARAGGPATGDAGEPSAAGVQLCQGHCPVHHVAAEFPQLCEAETQVFGRLLGVHVQRLATLAHGEHVCTTYVPVPSRRVTS